ncbi:nuclear transport factor 2 family protein [Leucobacter sp. CSA2]|uniref:Nuclear transport factor 2 family protein n=1 Tax=Leucobacter edaphi TaxID=2796472 RepID=A0A934UY63_9MICO|nr:nuclear transport factor 2 family protein [Leucobacter edaphi]MBK0422436.1 nuclear transport factor 2 family protein [Leucobacter edaphi]
MYGTIVRRKVEQVFSEINRGNWHAMVDGLGDPFHYRFHGDHALGGVRTSRATIEAWWERVTRLLPGAKFEVREVLVTGWPWRTRVAARLRVSGDLPTGEVYDNTMFQFMTIRWGRVTEIETLENLQILERALASVAAAGQTEAIAAPIVD